MNFLPLTKKIFFFTKYNYFWLRMSDETELCQSEMIFYKQIILATNIYVSFIIIIMFFSIGFSFVW